MVHSLSIPVLQWISKCFCLITSLCIGSNLKFVQAIYLCNFNKIMIKNKFAAHRLTFASFSILVSIFRIGKKNHNVKFALKKYDVSKQSLNISLNPFHFHPLFVYGCKNNHFVHSFFFVRLPDFYYIFIYFTVRIFFPQLFQKLVRKAKKFFSKPKRKFANSFKFWQPIYTAFKFEKLLKGKHNKFPCDFNSQLKKARKKTSTALKQVQPKANIKWSFRFSRFFLFSKWSIFMRLSFIRKDFDSNFIKHWFIFLFSILRFSQSTWSLANVLRILPSIAAHHSHNLFFSLSFHTFFLLFFF